MRLEVNLFGPLRPYAPGSVVRLELAEGASVRDARAALLAALGAAAGPILERSVLASEEEVLPEDAPLPPGTRALAVLPPVCGG